MLSALKNFGITFLIAALLFGVIAYFATGVVTSTMNSLMTDEEDELSEIMQNTENQTPVGTEEGAAEPPNSTDEKTPEGESFHFLVVTTDYRPDLYEDYRPTLDHMYETDWYSVSASDTAGCLSGNYREIRASSIVLVRVDKEARQYTYTYFSPDTRVYTPSGYHTLTEVYNYYGMQTLADHINAMTGMKIKYTFLLNAYNFDEFIELCGAPTLEIAKDIYQNGKSYTTQYETTREQIGEDGNPWMEHLPNTFILGKGEVTLDETNLEVLTSLRETSFSDLSAKEAWTVELLNKYFVSMASLEEAQLKILLAQLITNRSEWGSIEGLNYTEPEEIEPMPEEVPAEEEPYNPWEDTASSLDSAGDGENGEDGNPDETEEEKKLWLSEPSEPEGPVLETNYTMNDFDSIYELFEAVTYFESVTVSYPGEFVEATGDEAAYFDPDLQAGLEKFQEYRANP
ncbi:MAG: LCP family protein [Eubacteriales bacterium]